MCKFFLFSAISCEIFCYTNLCISGKSTFNKFFLNYTALPCTTLNFTELQFTIEDHEVEFCHSLHILYSYTSLHQNTLHHCAVPLQHTTAPHCMKLPCSAGCSASCRAEQKCQSSTPPEWQRPIHCINCSSLNTTNFIM